MSDTPVFGTRLIGQTEKALNAILDRQLAGTGLTEPQWVTLSLTVATGGTVGRDQLVARVAGALKVSEGEAQAHVTQLSSAELLHSAAVGVPTVTLTAAGRQLHKEIVTAITEITGRLWGDLPADDLATAGRVLSTVHGRADAELATA